LPLRETTNEDKLSELRDIAAQYPVGSLERKAVEEEIRKLQVTSNK